MTTDANEGVILHPCESLYKPGRKRHRSWVFNDGRQHYCERCGEKLDHSNFSNIPAGYVTTHDEGDYNKPQPPADEEPLSFVYRNWRGEVSQRRVRPLGIRFGSTEWHPEPQWLLRAVDLDKDEEREFAMRDIGVSGRFWEKKAIDYQVKASNLAASARHHSDRADLAETALAEKNAELADVHTRLTKAIQERETQRIAFVRMNNLIGDILKWAESRCPCENDEPNPCSLCGASVENLEACKSAENTLPRDLLVRLRVTKNHGTLDSAYSHEIAAVAEHWQAKLDALPSKAEFEALKAEVERLRSRTLLVFDWAYTDPETGREAYARTPYRAEALTKAGVKLTPVYTIDETPAAKEPGR